VSLRVNVELTNPGQFFACCGLLELADRLAPGAEGWFEGGEFRIECDPAKLATIKQLLQALIDCPLTNTMSATQLDRLRQLTALGTAGRSKAAEEEMKALTKLRRTEPIVLGSPFNLHIDWFLDDRAGGNRFKTWAGQQGVLDIASAMKRAIQPTPGKVNPAEACLRASVLGGGLPFYFDSDIGAQVTAIDVGFSADPLKISSAVRPYIELLAFVGLQRFRPCKSETENRYSYAIWGEPLSPILAAAVCGCAVEVFATAQYEFSTQFRNDYYKSFLPSQPVRGDR